MKTNEIEDFHSGKDEVELTSELIEKLVSEKKWSDVESLKEMADMGAKWNLIRNTIVFTL